LPLWLAYLVGDCVLWSKAALSPLPLFFFLCDFYLLIAINVSRRALLVNGLCL
jgi:hypothetical protein